MSFREAEDERRLRRIEAELAKLKGWRVDVARELRELESFAERYGTVIDAMIEQDKIALAVAAKLAAGGEQRWSRWTKVVAVLVAAAAVGGFVIELVRVAGG